VRAIYIRNSVRSNTPQYNVPLKYNGVTVASPVSGRVQGSDLPAVSASPILSIGRSDDRDVSVQPPSDAEKTGDNALESREDYDKPQTAEAVKEPEMTADDTADNAKSGDISPQLYDDGYGLFKKAPLETVPDGYDCRGEPRRAGFCDIAEFSVLADTAAGDVPRDSRRVSDNAEVGGVRDKPDDVPSDNARDVPNDVNSDMRAPVRTYDTAADGDDMNILEKIAAVNTDDMLLCALILLILTERGQSEEIMHDDNILLLLGFLLLSGR